jgi:hypothetical protein
MALHDKYPNMEPDDFYEAKYEDSKSFYNRGWYLKQIKFD